MKKLLLIFSFLSTFFLTAQDKEKDKEKPKKNKTISELTKTSKKIEGLFIIYQDTVSGELKMEIGYDQLNQDYIYFSQVADGVTEAGSFRGAYGSSVIFHIKLLRILLLNVQMEQLLNPFYYNPLSKHLILLLSQYQR